jgi:hypothetical protein
MSGQAREAAGDLAGQLTLDQLALLAEFDGDPAAVEQIVAALRDGYSAEYVAERIRQDRAEAAEHERLRAELEAAGTPVTGELPDGAVRLTALVQDHDDLTPEAHANCPGRGVFFPCGVPELGHRPWSGLLRGAFVFVEEAAEDGLALDPLVGQVGDGVVGPGRVQLAAVVGSPPVVVPGILGHDQPQMPLAEDQHPVGDLGPGGKHEPFRIGVGTHSQQHPVRMISTDVCG